MTQCISCVQKRVLRVLIQDVRKQFSPRYLGLAISRPQLLLTPATTPHQRSYQRRHCPVLNLSQIQKRHASDLLHEKHRSLHTELARAIQVTNGPIVPDEAAILEALRICEHLAKNISEPTEAPAEPLNPETTPTSNLLTLAEHENKQAKSRRPLRVDVRAALRDRIADAAYQIVIAPNTFMTTRILKTYVDIQAILHRPQSFPQVFDLYAAKPVPRADSMPVTYSNPNPNNPKAAISLSIATTALDAAIQAKDLALCLNIITTTVATSAFKRKKYLRKALFPTIALVLSPGAAYMLGKTFSNIQDRLDPVNATFMGSLGFMTYFSMTALTGYIAITTANDQMDRVTWRIGTPLYQRWFREEERAFTDKVAQAWGFKDYLRRGEEEGEDWKNLRQWVMKRDMDLDKPELMEGME